MLFSEDCNLKLKLSVVLTLKSSCYPFGPRAPSENTTKVDVRPHEEADHQNCETKDKKRLGKLNTVAPVSVFKQKVLTAHLLLGSVPFLRTSEGA